MAALFILVLRSIQLIQQRQLNYENRKSRGCVQSRFEIKATV